jgi:hypothetical protein
MASCMPMPIVCCPATAGQSLPYIRAQYTTLEDVPEQERGKLAAGAGQ